MGESDHHLETGKIGEKISRLYLIKHGYKVLERNYRTRVGEIDIIAEKGNIIVFCEVKARTSKFFGEPFEAVTSVKRDKITKVASQYLQETSRENVTYRFDVISILLNFCGKAEEFKHIEAAF